MHIYPRVLKSMLDRGVLAKTDRILVLAAGNFDRETFLALGFTNVTISNLEYHDGHKDYSPFEWRRIDAEKIDLEDGSFDWTVIHAGLHHLAVPAMGVCEMFRVARKGVLCFEARDSLMMRLAIHVGLTSEHELEPALLSGGANGGYRNGPIPNYVYRWTEREFEKVINSYAPTHRHTFFFNYGFSVPTQRFAMARSIAFRAIGKLIQSVSRIAEVLLPKQGNQFSFGAMKNTSLQPWLTPSLEFKEDYLSSKYDKSMYPKRR